MANIFEIAFLMPGKYIPVKSTTGKLFDDEWFYKRLFDWQMKVPYREKIEKNDFKKVQVRSSFPDPTYVLYSTQGYPITAPAAGTFIANDSGGVGIYEFNIGFTTIDPGYYCGLFTSTLGDQTFRFISEPWHVAVKHNNTSVVRYTNSLNDFGVMFKGVDQDAAAYTPEFSFRCECAVMDYDPKRDRTSYRDQILNVTTEYAMPYRQGKFYVGGPRGVAEWVPDLMGRIICCDTWYVNDLQMETPDGTEFAVARKAGYPLVSASIDVVPAQNLSGYQLNDIEAPGGIFAAYDIITEAFGTLNAPPEDNDVVLETVEP